MKKIISILLLSCLAFFAFSAENLKVKVDGPEGSYNQLRITNNTKYSNFDAKVVLLEKQGEKYFVKETLGEFHLKEFGDTDTCKMNLKNGQTIGISIPQEKDTVWYTIIYRDLPFFDIMEVCLIDFESAQTPQVGQEF